MLRKTITKFLVILVDALVVVSLFIGITALINKNSAAVHRATWGDDGTLKCKEMVIESADGKRLTRIYSNGDETMMTVETSRGPRTVSVSYLARRFGE